MPAPDREILLSTFGYIPALGDLEAFIGSGVFAEVLLVGVPLNERALGDHQLRVLDQSPTLPSGIYWFGGLENPALMVIGEGDAPGSPATLLSEESEGSALDDALDWFEHLWEQARPVPTPGFDVLDHVILAADGTDGMVRHRQYIDGTWFYTVFLGGRSRTITESGLAALPALDTPDAWITRAPDPVNRFAATITRAKLEKEFTDTVFSFRATRTVFRPYQFRPVMKLLDGGSLRLLIADEVGLGKTIEAGLLWTELEARRQADRVLVVCPSTLTTKWRREMEERFGFDLLELDRRGLRGIIERLETGRLPRRLAYVCSLPRLRQWEELQRATDLGLQFDLVVVDEAHQFRNSDTRSHALGEHLSQWADALVFLSATPVNLHNRDLYNLLELLVPGEFVDLESLRERIEPNQFIHRIGASLLDPHATSEQRIGWLENASATLFGSVLALRPEYRLLRDLLTGPTLSAAQVALAKRLISELHGLSAQITRTRKAEVQERKAIRQTDLRLVDWTSDEHEFYEDFRGWCVERAAAQGMPLHFAMQMPLRLAGSCLPQAAEYVRSWAGVGAEDGAETDAIQRVNARRAAQDDVPPSRSLVRAAQRLTADTKRQVFESALEDLLAQGKQILVFTFSRRTLAYLSQNLRGTCRVAELHGDVGRDERDAIMAAFRAGAYDVVLATKVASEGLDFEFCSTLVNYDLPWNPMEIEQRIGRIDRIGQREAKMVILNFSTPGTIETDILERVMARIGVFEESIGELEPIVQDMWKDLERSLVDFELSSEQRDAVERQTFAAIEARKADLNEVESAAPMLISSDGADIEGLDSELLRSGRYVGQLELALLVSDWISTYGGRTSKDDLSLVVTGNAELANHVQGLVRSGERVPHEVQPLAADLRSESQIRVSLDQENSRTSALPLLTASHPLVRAALSVPVHRQARFSIARIPQGDVHSPGHFLVLIATATWKGVRTLHELWTHTVDTSNGRSTHDLGDALMAAVAEGVLMPGSESLGGDLKGALSVASAALLSRQAQREDQLLKENQAFAETRRLTAEQVHQRRLDAIQQRIDTLRSNGGGDRMVNLQTAQLRRQQQRFDALNADLTARAAASLSVEHMAICLVEVS